MAPNRRPPGLSLHSRAARSARNPRGIYAPPTSTTHSSTSAPACAPADQRNNAAPSPSLKRKSQDDDEAFDLRVSKKDKRTLRRNTLLARVEGGRVGKEKKRRRPERKLKTDLGGLGEALPDTAPALEGEWVGLSSSSESEEGVEGAGVGADVRAGEMEGLPGLRRAARRQRRTLKPGEVEGSKMVMKTLRHRPGAMKRKRKMEGAERERFGRNLAQMVGRDRGQDVGKGMDGDGAAEGEGATASQSEGWEALRRFIGGTMVREGAFGAT